MTWLNVVVIYCRAVTETVVVVRLRVIYWGAALIVSRVGSTFIMMGGRSSFIIMRVGSGLIMVRVVVTLINWSMMLVMVMIDWSWGRVMC